MRTSHATTALAAFTAGLTAAAALRRLARPSADVATAAALPPVVRVPDHDAVVLPFTRPVVAGPVTGQLESPTCCGDSGGRTKAGAPCGVRTTTGGGCHHHPIAA